MIGDLNSYLEGKLGWSRAKALISKEISYYTGKGHLWLFLWDEQCSHFCLGPGMIIGYSGFCFALSRS